MSLIFYPQIILPIQIESCFVDMQPFIAINVCSILTYDNNHIETEGTCTTLNQGSENYSTTKLHWTSSRTSLVAKNLSTGVPYF